MTKGKQIQNNMGGEKSAILTKKMRENLNSDKISDDLRHNYHNKLNKIFPDLFEDLKIIRKSKHLQSWRSYHGIYDYEWKYRGQVLSNMFSEFERLYVEAIKSFVGKDKQRYFWIDSSSVHSKSRISQRALNKDYIFRKLSFDFIADKKKLEKAFDLNIIPYEKKNAISLKQLSIEVSKGKYKTEVSIPNHQIKKQAKTELQKLWDEIRPEWKSITSKAEKRGYKLLPKLPLHTTKNIEKVN